jgi:hypothetical protein
MNLYNLCGRGLDVFVLGRGEKKKTTFAVNLNRVRKVSGTSYDVRPVCFGVYLKIKSLSIYKPTILPQMLDKPVKSYLQLAAG